MHRQEYRIGRFLLQPHRQLLVGSTPVAIGRRALDLLSVLAAAEGGLVTKDELVEAVWPNTFVEDNAVQAQIAAARKSLGPEADRLATVRGLGYRLAAEAGQDAPPAKLDISREPIAIMRRPLRAVPIVPPRAPLLLVGLAVVTVLAVAGAGLIWTRLQHPAADTVSLQPFDTAGQPPVARSLASNLANEVGSALSEAGIHMVEPQPHGIARGALILDGAVQLQGSDLHLTARLENAADRAVLWSTSFARPAGEAAAMQEQVAYKLADVLQCALDAAHYPDGRVEPEVIRLYLHACDLEHKPRTSDQVRDIYQQIVARQPQFASAWSRLAYTSANAAFAMQPEQAKAVREEAVHDAQVALRLNPHDALAYEAIADAGLGRLRFDQLYALFARALAAEPDKPEVLEDEGDLLLRMGRIGDAEGQLIRSSSLQPWSPDLQYDMIQIRTDEGAIDAARTLTDHALRLWPDDIRFRVIRFRVDAAYGDAKVARTVIADAGTRGFALSDADKLVFDALLTWREHPGPAAASALVRQTLTAYRAGQVGLEEAVSNLAQAGALNEAFGIAAQGTAHFDPTTVDPEFLWQPATLSLRRDPRFITLATRMGVADFWRRTGKWPDFCSAPGWPYDCKAVAAKPPPIDTLEASGAATRASIG